MKKIFIAAHSLEIGGAERSLLGLLENINYRNVHVDLFLLRHTGELMSHLPREVNLLPESPAYSCLGIPLLKVIRRGQLAIAFGRMYGKLRAHERVIELGITGDNNITNEYSHKYTVQWLPMMSGQKYSPIIFNNQQSNII